ncbi:hypothetical protein HPO96_23470 [Kribbella sandramycini]|uniref:Glycosyl hydrolase family 43 n=1 Tax=Kribbella sandramycini TaxID=60450 RepID=A0A7Y4L2K0_9ACTN|nr:hypothetical protein [Kribbella sandramycini]MBB6571391.1 hypothetical protein [Kribbella sandramycini]NOL43209.1 hypothetical protein [Kribbella sandramycini]
MFRRIAAVLVVLTLLPLSAAHAAVGGWSAPIRLYAASDVQGRGYAYAPSAVADNPTRLYTCHSKARNTIRDDIFLTRVGVSSRSVLAPAGTGWDSWHNCDPSVVRVNVPFNGQTYSYAMFYLGNDVDRSAHNAIGVAVAHNLDGPWVKFPNPVIPFPGNHPDQWGAGQPSATTINAAEGTVVLAWTQGLPSGNTGKAAQISFGSGTPVVQYERTLPMAGLTTATGAQDDLNNFDLVYSPPRDRFFMVREGHPYPVSNPNYISDHVQIASISGADFWASSGGSWRVESTITSARTGKARTHNPGFLRTVYGTLPNESALTVVYTSADPDPDSLWSYTLWQTTAALS